MTVFPWLLENLIFLDRAGINPVTQLLYNLLADQPFVVFEKQLLRNRTMPLIPSKNYSPQGFSDTIIAIAIISLTIDGSYPIFSDNCCFLEIPVMENL